MPMPKQTLVKYVVSEDGRRRGLFLATSLNDEEYGVSFSSCAPQDQFTKKRGLHIALCRALQGFSNAQLPFYMLDEYPVFMERCARFFKGKQAVVAEEATYEEQTDKERDEKDEGGEFVSLEEALAAMAG